MNKQANITKESIQRIYPLLPMQKGMLFHALRDPEDTFYFEQVRYRLRGEFDVSLCERVWNRLLKRHELLRSVFVSQNVSKPVQIVLKQRQVDFQFLDLRSIPSAERMAYLEELLLQERQKGFDLSRDVLIRIRVYQCRDRVYEMVWNFPHILLDGWSGGILQSEFITLYEAYVRNKDPELPPPADYNLFLDWLEKRHFEDDLAYWKNLLQDYDALASVPVWKQPGPRQGYEPAEYTFSISQEQTQALNQLANRLECTTNVILQTLWAVILARYNQVDDVVFGMVVSGRPPEVSGIERLVGLFINTLPLRIRLDGLGLFSDIVRDVQTQFMESQEHSCLSIAEIQSALPISHALLDHLFVYENYPVDGDKFEKINQSGIGFEVEATSAFEQVNYSFGMLVHPGKELRITCNYDKQRHDHIQMQYMEGHWRSLLGQVIENPSISVHDLEILSEREKDNVLHRFQGDIVEYPQEKTLVDLWEQQAEKTPDRVALSFEGRSLTYEQLDQRSTALANQLQHRFGIQLGDHIGLLMDRGIDLIVSLLGIMKAGGVYIPIDPAYPCERIDFIIQDAKCDLLIVENETDKEVHKYESGQILDIQDVDWTRDKRQEVHASSRNVAYMIYTSGSTGQPKGVMIEHRGFINMIQEQIRAFDLSETDRVLQFASCAFDASLSEVFMTLLSGACLVLVPEDTILDVQLLGSFLSRQAITVATFPPSYLRAINQMEIPGLRVMITAGETLIEEDARFYASCLRYFNAYGPTEASVCATYHEVEAEEIGNGPVPIGRPLVNTKILILDSMLRPVPIGVIGEICIAGPGLASGYWNRPEENKKRFVRHPLADGGKLYRTGDLGRWLHTGCIEFLGRMDSQVKINGYRIEMAEVEKHIRGCPGVEQAVVQVMEQEGRDKFLVAYIVLSSRVKIDKLQAELRKSLPEFMIPKDIVFLDELPLTPNQKVDRKQLPDPRNMASEGQGYIAPRDLNEEKLAGIWEEVLGRRPIGIYDSFFDKGGHSLLAIQLVGRMEKAGFSIPLKVLYEYPTIAQVIEHASNNAQEDKSPIVSGTFHLTPVQRWFFQSRDEEYHHFNHYVLLKSIETVDADSLAKALYALWLHHDGLRSRFDLYSSQIKQIIEDDSCAMPFEIIDWREHPQAWQDLEERIQAEQQSLDLEKGPLCRQILFRLPDADYFFWLIHHLITDAVSWNILLSDLEEAYRQALPENPIVLPTKTCSYKQWSETLQKQATHPEVLQEKSYWAGLEELSVPPLPLFRPDSLNVYGNTDQVYQTVPMDGVRPAFRASPVPGLLTAFGLALDQWSGNRLFRVLLTRHGRNIHWPGHDVHRTTGWFTSNFPIVLDLGSSKDVDNLFSSISAQYKQIPLDGMKYGILRYLTPTEHTKDMAWNDCPILFNYMGEVFSKQNQSHFALCSEYSGASISPAMKRPFLLELDVLIQDDSFYIHLSYNKEQETRTRMAGILQNMAKYLTSLSDCNPDNIIS